MRTTRSLFFQKCQDAYELVQLFLSDDLSLGHLDGLLPKYEVSAERGQIVKEKVRKSLQVLSDSLESHSLDEVAISYNGGKDCLVMLTLLLTAIHIKYRHNGPTADGAFHVSDHEMDSIYIKSELPFPELTDFIERSSRQYHLNLFTIQSSLKAGFEHFLKNINPKVKRIVVGIRFSDPYGSELQYEQPTDHNWPEFIRIHPILHWQYCDVWHFLLCCNIRYCSLYSHGYTSLGGVESTVPNPYLRSKDGYLPAYALQEKSDERERLGRLKKSSRNRRPRSRPFQSGHFQPAPTSK